HLTTYSEVSLYLRDLHSFPTRRSSDLLPSSQARTRSNAPCIALTNTTPKPKNRTLAMRASCSSGRSRRRPNGMPRTGKTTSTARSEEHTSELQSRENLVCRLLLEKKKT